MALGARPAVVMGALAFASCLCAAAPSEPTVFELRQGAVVAKGAGPLLAAPGSSKNVRTALEPVALVAPGQALDGRFIPAEGRATQAGKVIQGGGLISTAAAATAFTRAQSEPVGVEPDAGPAGETDPGALILAGLGVAGFLLLRRRAGS